MPERGTYVSLADLKRAVGESATTNDASLLAAAEDASRYLDGECHRKFFSQTATRYFTARNPTCLNVDDILSVTTLKTDQDGDRTYETTWQTTDFDLSAGGDFNAYPYWQLTTTPLSSYWFPRFARGVEITGLWGYGDGTANPWLATAITITVATTTGLTLTASSATNPFAAGQTLLVGTEQVYLTAVSGATLTAERAVNGTTAATHAAAVTTIAQYPRLIARAALMLAEQMTRLEGAPFGVAGSPEMATQTLSHDQQVFVLRVFSDFRRAVIG
jgi:hypothetical protein